MGRNLGTHHASAKYRYGADHGSSLSMAGAIDLTMVGARCLTRSVQSHWRGSVQRDFVVTRLTFWKPAFTSLDAEIVIGYLLIVPDKDLRNVTTARFSCSVSPSGRNSGSRNGFALPPRS